MAGESVVYRYGGWSGVFRRRILRSVQPFAIDDVVGGAGGVEEEGGQIWGGVGAVGEDGAEGDDAGAAGQEEQRAAHCGVPGERAADGAAHFQRVAGGDYFVKIGGYFAVVDQLNGDVDGIRQPGGVGGRGRGYGVGTLGLVAVGGGEAEVVVLAGAEGAGLGQAEAVGFGAGRFRDNLRYDGVLPEGGAGNGGRRFRLAPE